MSSDASAFTWRRIRDSLDGDASQSLAARLREALAPLRSGGLSKGRLDQAKNVVKDLLQAELGPWYTESGLPLGNELATAFVFESWVAPPPETLRAAAARVAEVAV